MSSSNRNSTDDRNRLDTGIPLPLERFFHWEKFNPEGVFIKEYDVTGAAVKLTWQQAAYQVRAVAAYLMAQGLERGDHIGILAKSGSRWILADLAIWLAGGVSVIINPSDKYSVTEQQILASDLTYVFLDHAGSLDKAEIDKLHNITPIFLSPETNNKVAGLSWPSIVDMNIKYSEIKSTRLHGEAATIIFSPGTSGALKAVVHSFNTLAFCASHMATLLDIHTSDCLVQTGSFCHVANRLLNELMPIYQGCTLVTGVTVGNRVAIFQEVMPTVVFAVPVVWTELQSNIYSFISEKKLTKGLKWPIASSYYRHKINEHFGLQKIRYFLSGIAPMPQNLVKWYQSLNYEFIQLYGLTENFGYSHSTLHRTKKYSTVGLPNPKVEVKIAESQEVLVRSPASMLGYYNDPEATQAAFTNDHFLKTGDLGVLDMDNELKIKGRISDTFKSKRGRLIAPFPIESKLSLVPCIKHCWVFGNALSQPMALIVLADSYIKAFQQIELRNHLNTVLESELRELNNQLNPHEKLRQLIVVKEDWTVENGLLASNYCLKRDVLAKRFEERIEQWTDNPHSVVWEA